MNWICNICTAAYSVGADECPQCGSGDHRDEGTPEPTKAKTASVPADKAKTKAIGIATDKS